MPRRCARCCTVFCWGAGGRQTLLHVRWVMDDPAVATLMGMERVRGEDALPRLGKGLDRESLRQWLTRPANRTLRGAAGSFHRRLGFDGEHPLRSSGRRPPWVTIAQARAQEPSSADLRGGTHTAVPAPGMAAGDTVSATLATGDGKTLVATDDPRTASGSSRRMWASVRRRSWPGMKPKAKSVRNTCSNSS